MCRILFVNVAAKIVGLSAAPHILHLVPVSFELKFGDVLDPATIIRVDAGVGVTLSFAPDIDIEGVPKPEEEGEDAEVCQVLQCVPTLIAASYQSCARAGVGSGLGICRD